MDLGLGESAPLLEGNVLQADRGFRKLGFLG